MAPKRRSGQEFALLDGRPLAGATVTDFWTWGFSDLMANNIRGVLAEWLVAKLLDLPLEVRDSWEEYDLISQNGVRIEVKAAAYLQTWDNVRPSRINFTGLKGRVWKPETRFEDTQTFNADIYVFCIQTEQDRAAWDALDLNQWRFYILERRTLEEYGTNSLALGTLRSMAAELSASEFRERGKETIQRLGERSMR